MNDAPDASGDEQRIPLFPLPNIVLFPGAILPLHIFETRYLRMIADVLAGDSRIAMAMLLPGWERDYYGLPPIEPVVCVGRIVAHERLVDGKYNLLLHGDYRATVLRETARYEGADRYRVGRLARVAESAAMEIDLDDERRRLVHLFEESALGATGAGHQFARLLAGPMLTAEIADRLAFNYLEDVALKQSLLADGDVRRRVSRIVRALDQLRASLPARRAAGEASRPGGASLN